MKVLQMSGSSDSVMDVLERARKFAQEEVCDEVVVVFQQRDGTKPWFARDSCQLQALVFLMTQALFNFQCMAAGIKI